MGNPYVSCSWNAWCPGSVRPPPDRTAVTAVSKIVVPARRVCANASSSAYAYVAMRPKSEPTSGYDGAIASRETGSSSDSTGPS